MIYDKALLSVLAIALTLLAFVPYIRSIRRGYTRPHVFSWLIWGSTTCVVFVAQLTDRAGVGAWPIGVSGLITLYIAWLAFQHARSAGERRVQITRSDWLFFSLALLALPVWLVTANPLWAVLLLTLVDVLGFAPTFRKAYHFPYEEHLLFYMLITVRNLLAVAALQHYSLTTVFFPLVMAITCMLFILMVVYRRRKSCPG